MKLGEKLRHLRFVEGNHRGLARPLTKAEVVRAMGLELGQAISHAYLCQLESGARVHMTAGTRELLARFFKVLPGYLVDDPEGFETSLRTEVPAEPDWLKGWLAGQTEVLRDEPYLGHVLLKLSRMPDPRRYVTLLDRLLELPADALTEEESRVARIVSRESAEQGPESSHGTRESRSLA